MKKKSVVLRKGFEEDLDAFFDLYWISSLEHTHYSGALDTLKPKNKCKKYIISRQRELLKDPNQFFFVAEDKKKIIGMATGHVGERDEAVIYAIERIGFVDEICIHPEYRNSGAGSKLLEILLKELYSQGIEFIGVGVAFKNPAFHFYKTCGFIPEGMWLIQQKKSRTKKQRRKK
ncbi:MAG: GNAT family N-acetyltransferase [Thermoplasmata archaeon]|nr:GNAT family N-acetyltransferase [Thermoplasmata archaeon]